MEKNRKKNTDNLGKLHIAHIKFLIGVTFYGDLHLDVSRC